MGGARIVALGSVRECPPYGIDKVSNRPIAAYRPVEKLTLADMPDGRPGVRVSIPAKPLRYERIRVRLGPCSNRAEAEKAAAKATSLGLQAAILTL